MREVLDLRITFVPHLALNCVPTNMATEVVRVILNDVSAVTVNAYLVWSHK